MSSELIALWVGVGYTGLILLFSIIAMIHDFVIWGSDCLNTAAFFTACKYTMSFYVYLSFGISLISEERDKVSLILGILALILLVTSWAINLLALHKTIDRNGLSRYSSVLSWSNNPMYCGVLFMAVSMNGSAFASVSLFNSMAFGHPLFCMGLSRRELAKYGFQRLMAPILSQDLPIFIIAIASLAHLGFFETGILAVVFSAWTLFIDLPKIYSAKRLHTTIENTLGDVTTELTFELKSSEIVKEERRLRISTNGLREILVGCLLVLQDSIEISYPTVIDGGLLIRVVILSDNRNTATLVRSLKDIIAEGDMQRQIKGAWRLMEDVSVENLTVLSESAVKDEAHVAINIHNNSSDNDEAK